MTLPTYGAPITRVNAGAAGATELNDLSDVTIAAPAADDVLVYDGVDTWRNRPVIVTGTYTGDGTTSQAITGVGFAPKYVRIWPRTTVTGDNVTIFETTPDIVDDNAAGGAIGANEFAHDFLTDTIIALGADGFTVDDRGGDIDPNVDGKVYNYLALG